MFNSEKVKERIIELGADICGIAPTERFKDAPKGFHPCHIFPECKSVIAYGSRFPMGSLKAYTNSPYTLVRNLMVDKLDRISFHLSIEFEKDGITAMPIPSAEPYDYWDSRRSHGRGILSLKHAGALAGLGIIGKNTLLLNNVFGNMVWLGAVLVSTELDPDQVVSYEACIPGCTLCIDECPKHALDGITLNQKRCRERSISYTDGGGWVLSCNICRKVCPRYRGWEGG